MKDADLKEIEKIVYDHNTGDKKDKVTQHTVYSTDTVYNTYTYDYCENARYTHITDLEGRKTTKWYDEQYYTILSIDPEGRKTSAEYYVSEGNIDWEVKTRYRGYGRKDFSMVSYGNDIYVIGGLNYDERYFQTTPSKLTKFKCYNTLDNFEVYNTSAGYWDTLRSIPSENNQYGRANSAAVYYNGDIYVAGGIYYKENGFINDYGYYIPIWDPQPLKSVYKYNISSRSWTKVADMNYPRDNFSLVELGGYLYAIDEGCIEKYDPKSNKWTYIPVSGYSCSKAIVCNGKIYGRDSQYRLLEFNTANNTWSVICDSSPEGWLVVRNNKLLTINEETGLIYEYVFEQKGWTPVASLEMPKISGFSRYGGIVCNGNVYTFLCDYTSYEGERDFYNYVIEGKWNDKVKINRFGEIKSITDRNGNRFQYEIDGRGNITKIINPDNSTREYTYDEKNNLLSEKDEEGKYTFYQYDSNKINIIKKIQPLSSTINYVEGVNDSLFAITKYEYYAPENCYGFKGMLYKVIDPEGNVTTYTYNSKGDVETIKDGENKTTTYRYNNISWLTSETSGKGYVTQYEYDLNGRLVRKKLDGGETTRIVYDKMGRKIKEVSPKQYDATLDGLNKTTKTYDYSGDHGERTAYYRSGLVSQHTDAENNIIKYNYDRYGNLATEEYPNPNGVSTARGAVYEYKYDTINRLKEVRYKENASATSYKTLEKYDYLILEDGKTQTIHTTYLNDTQIAIVKTTYDFMNRPLIIVNPDLTSIEMTYYKNGLLKTEKDEAGFETYYNYDSMNRLVEVWTPVEVSDGKIKYSYTKKTYYKNSLLNEEMVAKEKVEYPNKGTTYFVTKNNYYRNGELKEKLQDNKIKLAYEYDADNNLSSEKVYTSATEYILTKYENNYFGKPFKKLQSVRKGDISGNTFTDNTLIDLVTIYTYDKNGNIETITSPEQIKTTFGYDNLNRQTSVSYEDSFVEASGNTKTGIIKTSKVYNYAGNPIRETDANGNVTEYSYNNRGMLEKVIKKNVTIDGTKVDLIEASVYDLGGRVIAKIKPKYYDSSKAYNQLNRTEFIYDLMGRVIAEKQVYMDTATSSWINYVSKAYKYDEKGRIVKELDALGYEAGTGSTVEEKIRTGYGKEYTYTPNGKIETVAEPVTIENGLSYTTKYTYDTMGNLISEIDARGVIKNYYYDNSGNLTDIKVKASSSAAEQTIQRNTYDYAGNLISQTDGNGNTVNYQYNAFKKLKQAIYPTDSTIAQNTVIYQYDKDGNLKYQKDTFGTVDLYEYNKAGKVKSHTRKPATGTDAAITTSQEYDANGNVRKSVDGRGTTTVYNYDELNNLISQTVVVSGITQTTTYKYDKNGNKTQTTDWRGNTSKIEYDQLDRVIRTVDPYDKTIQKYEYNRNNAQIKAYDALNNMTEYKYDKNNRLIETIDPEKHSTIQEYDEVGNIIAKTDGNGYTTTYEYDEFNRLVAVINPLMETTTYTYDLNGNMLSQTDGEGNRTDYRYNVVNKVVKIWNMGSDKVESYTYYPNGLVKTKQDKNGDITNYEYDCHGRLKKKSVGSLTVQYTYDGNGNQLTITDSTGTTERTYDELNRVKTKKVPNFGTITYTYDITAGVDLGFTAEQSKDPKGNITTKVYDKAGRIKYVYDGNLTSTSKTEYNYYDNGSVKNVIYPNGYKEEYTYYKDNLLWTLKNYKKSGSTDVVMDSYTYTYDRAHNQTSKVEVINGVNKGTTSYTYDVLNRLKTVNEPNGRTTSYEYDRAGNRKSEAVVYKGETTTTTYEYSKDNRLMSSTKKQGDKVVEREIYGYDFNGNMTYKSKSTIQSYDVSEGESIGLYAETMGDSQVIVNSYDGFNQLIKTQIGDMNISYVYNGEGYRVEKTVNDATTRYMYESDKVVLETDGKGNQTGRNIYGTNLLMRKAGNDTLYYMYNGHADVTALIDASTGVVRASYYYDAFGNIQEQKYYTSSGKETSEKINNSITYAGYQYDDETGLYYLNARMYDPKIARFLQEDTYRGDINDPLSLNLYTYCANNPIIYWDYSGHKYKNELLKYGMKDDNDIIILQKVLVSKGYLKMPEGVDYGYYGKLTRDAVKKYQKDHGLEDDGIVGDKTWESLGLLLEGPESNYYAYKQYNNILKSDPKDLAKAKVSGSVKTQYEANIQKTIKGSNATIANAKKSELENIASKDDQSTINNEFDYSRVSILQIRDKNYTDSKALIKYDDQYLPLNMGIFVGTATGDAQFELNNEDGFIAKAGGSVSIIEVDIIDEQWGSDGFGINSGSNFKIGTAEGYAGLSLSLEEIGPQLGFEVATFKGELAYEINLWKVNVVVKPYFTFLGYGAKAKAVIKPEKMKMETEAGGTFGPAGIGINFEIGFD
ncbi:RHS repeat-associated core domain-containing protein [Acetivibrio clariflavus]|uniref:RHS repeat-associated core domain-containing protein n=2 Tax=Acetivibrio clariflavus TaxID=288965 RepID=UPI0030B81B63